MNNNCKNDTYSEYDIIVFEKRENGLIPWWAGYTDEELEKMLLRYRHELRVYYDYIIYKNGEPVCTIGDYCERSGELFDV